jgi:OOP family OmpA-OmpF porin
MAQQTIGLSQILRFGEVTKFPLSINSEAEESMPLVSSDGKTMYFVRSFYKGNRGGKFAGQDIWVSKLEGDKWSTPTNQLGLLNNKKNNAVIGIGADNKTLFLLDTYGTSSNGVAFSRYFNNKWTKPESISIKGITKDGFKGFYMDS